MYGHPKKVDYQINYELQCKQLSQREPTKRKGLF